MQFSVVVGARPNFIKVAPLMRAISSVGIDARLIHTGQHYDERMSETFFSELNIPRPATNLGVAAGPAVVQIAEMMHKLFGEFSDHRPSALLVVGDVNSTLAAALVGQKMGIPLGHIEAGLRSRDRTMPEEINRILTDAISDWLFTSEAAAHQNLTCEGIPSERIHFVGNIMIDTLLSNLERARQVAYCEQLGLARDRFALLTMHRPSNVDNAEHLQSILKAVQHLCSDMPVVFPVHPRTRTKLHEFGCSNVMSNPKLVCIEPLGYLAMLNLMDSARLVLTDSGGVQEETTVLGTPCLTLRDNTERPITVEYGSNRLVGWRAPNILHAIEDVLSRPKKAAGKVPEKWDGRTATRIVQRLIEDLSDSESALAGRSAA